MKRRGITLVEVLVSIAIVLVLAAITFPIYRYARDAGIRTHCIQNLRQIHQAIEMYRDNHDGLPSLPSGLARAQPTVRSVFLCPKDDTKGYGLAHGGTRGNPNSPNFEPISYELMVLHENAMVGSLSPDIPQTERIYAMCVWHERREGESMQILAVFGDGHVTWRDAMEGPQWYEELKQAPRFAKR